MKNNAILRQIRYTFDYHDDQMIKIFALADHDVTRVEICDWLKKEEDEDYKPINDRLLAIFLNGFINHKRGKREGSQPQAEKQLTNNIIFRKIKIALNFKDTDILEAFERTGMRISKHELTAIFRKPSQSQYRECKDQFLRNFLLGLRKKHRPHTPDTRDAQLE